MKIRITELKQRLALAAQCFVPKSDADYFADLWLEAHLKKAPRMSPINEALADLKVWRDQVDHKTKTLVDKPGMSLLDFNTLAPSLKIKEIHDDLENRARTNGIAVTGIINSSGMITLNPWVEGLAKRDLIGIAMFNGGTECGVPHGGARGVLGTNPMAYAIPTADQPIALDMATTEIPYFEVATAKSNNIPLRENVAVDTSGHRTTDASKALDDHGRANLLPIGGGFKGYGLMLLIEVLTGSLIRSMVSTEQTSGWNPPEYGGLLLAIDVSGFTDLDDFKTKISGLTEALRNEVPGDEFDSVSVPGDRGFEKFTQALAAGEIDIDASVIDELATFTSERQEP